jgi:hypothetical protein
MGRRVYLKADTINNARIIDTGEEESRDDPPVQIVGSGTTQIAEFRSGFIGIGVRAEDTTILENFEQQGGGRSAPRAVIGDGCSALVSGCDVRVSAGSVQLMSNVNVSNPIDFNVNGTGAVDLQGGKAGIVLLDQDADFIWQSATSQNGSDQISLRGKSKIDFSRVAAENGIGVNTIERFSDLSWVRDPNGVISTLVIDNNQCRDTSRLVLKVNSRLTVGTAS